MLESKRKIEMDYKFTPGITTTEVDPNGLSPKQEGAKLDGNKPNMDLVLGDFAHALLAVAEIGTAGAKKYSESGWLKVPNARTRYRSALLRHYFKERTEGLRDLDSEEHYLHAAHAAWNALADLELLIRDLNNGDKRS
jgi:Domain of unknown function (DUF5664)